MTILNQLKKAINEADENSMLSDVIQVESDNIKFSGKFSYEGDSRIHLDLSFEMPTQTKTLISDSAFDSITEDQFSKASEKVKNALEDLAQEFKTSLDNKLASYGLHEGE